MSREQDDSSFLPSNLFKDRVALITGGGTGLGLEIARTFASLGASVAIASRDLEHLEAGERVLRAEGGEVRSEVCDVRKVSDVRKTVRVIAEEFGRLDILVNNAAGNFIRPAERLPEKAFSTVVDIVLNGTFYCSRAAGRVMIEQGNGGAILNILATYAWTGGPGTIHSACAKAGVLAMTRTLAVEWAKHGIRVNGIAPGPLETGGASDRLWPSKTLEESVRRGIPLGRFSTKRELADAAAYLVSDHASYITGEVLTLDGGAWLGKGILGSDPSESVPTVKRRRRPKPGETPSK